MKNIQSVTAFGHKRRYFCLTIIPLISTAQNGKAGAPSISNGRDTVKGRVFSIVITEMQIQIYTAEKGSQYNKRNTPVTYSFDYLIVSEHKIAEQEGHPVNAETVRNYHGSIEHEA